MLEDWICWYEKIVRDFGFSKSKDDEAANILSELIRGKEIGLDELKKLVSGKIVIVFGAGPSLKNDILRLNEKNLLSSCVKIAADGATSAFFEYANKFPEIIVSDLDGNIDDIIKAEQLGSKLVIHAHGDNIDKIKLYVPKFKKILGTTQVLPRKNLYNFGGFTDGDRCFFLAMKLGAKVVALAGMDLGNKIGKYSKLKPLQTIDVKLKKLRYCKKLLEWGARIFNGKFYNLTEKGEDIKGFKKVNIKEFERIVKDFQFSQHT
jgi:hypothetical protein